MAARRIAFEPSNRDQTHANIDGTLRVLSGLRMQVVLKRNNVCFNAFVALGASITSICHERCRLLVERERAHLERQLASLDFQISSLRKLDAELVSGARFDANADNSGALRCPSASAALTEADIERELDDISRRATDSCFLDAFEPNETSLRDTVSNFFDELENDLDSFYEAKVQAVASQCQVAPPSFTSDASSVAVSKIQTKRKNDESKRKANSALESIANAARIAKKCRQVPPVQLEVEESRAHSSRPHGIRDTEASSKDAEPVAIVAEVGEYSEPTPPRVGDTFECFMQHLETLDEFYIVRRTNHELCTPIINQAIEQLLAKRDETACVSQDDALIVGAAYVTQFDDDLCWYRTTVTRVDKVAQKATVRFVDFGNERTVPFPGSGWSLDRKILRVHQRHAPPVLLQTPTQVLRCSLAGVKLCNSSETRDKLCERLYAQLLDVLLVARVLNVRRLFTVPSGGYLPSECAGLGNPVVCDVLLCFADRLRLEPDYEHEHEHDQAMLQCSVQSHFVQTQPPLFEYVDGGPKLDLRSVTNPLARAQFDTGMRSVSSSSALIGKAHCIEMGVPVYITCMETPNAIFVVRRNVETVRQILDLQSQLASFVLTYFSLQRDDVDCNNCSMRCPTDQDIKQSRNYLLNLYSDEFDSIQRMEYLDNNVDGEFGDLGAKWHADAPAWKHLTLPCLWKSASSASSVAPWLRGLLVEVDFVRNTMAIVCVDFGGTAREPLIAATTSVAMTSLSNRLLRLPSQFALHGVPPFAACVCLADLISVSMEHPRCTYNHNRAQSQSIAICTPASLASVYETHINVAWITKAVESLGQAVFLNPDRAAAKQFGDHLPVVVLADGSLDDVNEHVVAAASSFHKVDENVLEDELAQNAVYLRIPSNSVFDDLQEYETNKRDLAKWLLVGCAAPLPLDGASRLAFRWPKAGVNLYVKKRAATPLSETAPMSSADNLELDVINLGNHLVCTGLASRFTLGYSAQPAVSCVGPYNAV